MHRPAPRRPRRVAALTALIALTALPPARTAAPLRRPNGRRRRRAAVRPARTDALGFGVVVAEDLVATAAHTVEGPLRDLRVDGRPATLVTADARTDLALLAVPDVGTEPAELSDGAPSKRHVADTRRGAARRDRLDRTARRARHDRRRAPRATRAPHLTLPSQDGTSGAPLVDDRNRVLGIVVLSEPADDVAYAVTAGELAALVAERPGTSLPAPQECPD